MECFEQRHGFAQGEFIGGLGPTNGLRYRQLGKKKAWRRETPIAQNKLKKRAESQPSDARCVGTLFLTLYVLDRLFSINHSSSLSFAEMCLKPDLR